MRIVVYICIIIALAGKVILDMGVVGIPVSIAAFLVGVCLSELVNRLILKL